MIVKESIEFKRGTDPKQSLDIGKARYRNNIPMMINELEKVLPHLSAAEEPIMLIPWNKKLYTKDTTIILSIFLYLLTPVNVNDTKIVFGKWIEENTDFIVEKFVWRHARILFYLK